MVAAVVAGADTDDYSSTNVARASLSLSNLAICSACLPLLPFNLEISIETTV